MIQLNFPLLVLNQFPVRVGSFNDQGREIKSNKVKNKVLYDVEQFTFAAHLLVQSNNRNTRKSCRIC